MKTKLLEKYIYHLAQWKDIHSNELDAEEKIDTQPVNTDRRAPMIRNHIVDTMSSIGQFDVIRRETWNGIQLQYKPDNKYTLMVYIYYGGDRTIYFGINRASRSGYYRTHRVPCHLARDLERNKEEVLSIIKKELSNISRNITNFEKNRSK